MKQQQKIVYKKTKVDSKKTLDNLVNSIEAYNKTVERKDQVNHGAASTLKQIYLDFMAKFRSGRTRDGAFRVTKTGLINKYNKYCERSIANHLARLVSSGYIKKATALCDFGKGVINCLLIKIDETLLDTDIDIEVKLKDAVLTPVVKIRLTDVKKRIRQTISLKDLYNSLKINV